MTEVAIAVVATLALVFGVAALLLVAASRTGLPVIPFYLLAGITAGSLIEEAYLLELAQWGIAFLVFAFAVDVDPLGEADVRFDAVVIGVLQVAVTGALVYGVAVAVGLAPRSALYVAVAGAFSSTLIALGHLREDPVRRTVTHERLGQAVHFVEDLVAVGVVLALSVAFYTDAVALRQVGAGVGMIVAVGVIRATGFDRVTSLAGDDVEILMLTGLSLLVGFVALAEAAGISIVVGAFAAGLAVPHEYPHDIDTLDAIGYVEDFFVPIFFVTLGALVTFPGLQTIGLAALVYVAVTVLNPAIVAGIALWRGYDGRSATLTGLNSDQVSEFSLIVVIEALLLGVIPRGVFDAIVLAAVASMLTSALTHQRDAEIYHWLVDRSVVRADLESVRRQSNVPEDVADHVIVVGFGPLGRAVVESCREAGHETVVVESDPAMLGTVRAHSNYFVSADETSPGAWQVARPETAALVVSTVRDRDRNRDAIERAGETDVFANATDPETAREYLDHGATYAAVPEQLAGEYLGELVERALTDPTYREELEAEGRETVERAFDRF